MTRLKTQYEMNPIPCPVCLKLMHWCEQCQEYHCNNSDCKHYIG